MWKATVGIEVPVLFPGAVAFPCHRPRAARRRGGGTPDRSALRLPARLRGPAATGARSSIEFLGFLPILLLVALAVVQLGLAAYAVQQAGTAARAAARTASMDGPTAQDPRPPAGPR